MTVPQNLGVSASKVVKRDIGRTLAVLSILLAVSCVPTVVYRYRPGTDTLWKKVFRTIQKRGLNQEGEAKQTAGYYDGLIDHAAEVTRVGGRGWLNWRFWLSDRTRRITPDAQFVRSRSDYLKRDLMPNVDVRDRNGYRVVTNSLGMADKEYAREPPPGTWRIALIGDSISQGWGTDYGTTFEAQLEEWLQKNFAGETVKRYEILNFSVTGYQLTQLVDVGLSRVPPFSPNVYVLALTERSVLGVWADHLAWLVANHVDPKYDFLNTIFRETKVSADLSYPVIEARLARYRLPTLRWAVTEVREQARRSGAEFVVLLVPASDDAESQIEQFGVVKQVLAEMGVPTADILDTFAYLDDLVPVRVSAADKHPNAVGHRMLFEALVRKIQSDVNVRKILTGIDVRSSAGADVAPAADQASPR